MMGAQVADVGVEPGHARRDYQDGDDQKAPDSGALAQEQESDDRRAEQTELPDQGRFEDASGCHLVGYFTRQIGALVELRRHRVPKGTCENRNTRGRVHQALTAIGW
jgi:hypothetical protein